MNKDVKDIEKLKKYRKILICISIPFFIAGILIALLYEQIAIYSSKGEFLWYTLDPISAGGVFVIIGIIFVLYGWVIAMPESKRGEKQNVR